PRAPRARARGRGGSRRARAGTARARAPGRSRSPASAAAGTSRSRLAPQHRQRAGLERELVARGEAAARVERVRRRELERPEGAEAARREREDGLLVVGVEEDEEGVVGERDALRRRRAELGAVQEDAQARRSRVPVAA